MHRSPGRRSRRLQLRFLPREGSSGGFGGQVVAIVFARGGRVSLHPWFGAGYIRPSLTARNRLLQRVWSPGELREGKILAPHEVKTKSNDRNDGREMNH